MCQQILQFCSGSTKPLLFTGGFLTILLAAAIGYTGYATNTLYQDIDPDVAQAKSFTYHLQLAAAGYLTLVTLLTCYSAHYDQKHSVSALAVICSINFMLAVGAILMVPGPQDIGASFDATLREAANLYNFTEKPFDETLTSDLQLDYGTRVHQNGGTVLNSSLALLANESRKPNSEVAADNKQDSLRKRDPLTAYNATRIWDRLQARGCCGINKPDDVWKQNIPKSCCAQSTLVGSNHICKEVDKAHQKGCMTLIGSNEGLLIVLALIALVNFYLAVVTILSTYRTFHYNEAAQHAYN